MRLNHLKGSAKFNEDTKCVLFVDSPTPEVAKWVVVTRDTETARTWRKETRSGSCDRMRRIYVLGIGRVTSNWRDRLLSHGRLLLPNGKGR